MRFGRAPLTCRLSLLDRTDFDFGDEPGGLSLPGLPADLGPGPRARRSRRR